MKKDFKLFDDVPSVNADTLDTQGISDTQDIPPVNEKQFAAYLDQQAAAQKADRVKINIIKMILTGDDPYHLLLQAIHCIGLATGDAAFYSQTADQIKLVYGSEALESLPAEFELQEVRQRLKMLCEYDLKTVEGDKRSWIVRAINLHKEREASLLKQIVCG